MLTLYAGVLKQFGIEISFFDNLAGVIVEKNFIYVSNDNPILKKLPKQYVALLESKTQSVLTLPLVALSDEQRQQAKTEDLFCRDDKVVIPVSSKLFNAAHSPQIRAVDQEQVKAQNEIKEKRLEICCQCPNWSLFDEANCNKTGVCRIIRKQKNITSSCTFRSFLSDPNNTCPENKW